MVFTILEPPSHFKRGLKIRRSRSMVAAELLAVFQAKNISLKPEAVARIEFLEWTERRERQRDV